MQKKIIKKGNIINGEYCDIETIDNFVNDRNIKRIDFIKIDTEGHDLFVLKGANNTIKKHLPIIQIEVIDYILQLSGEKVSDVINYIRNLNLYKMYYFFGNSRYIKEIKGDNYPKGMDLLLIPSGRVVNERFKNLIVP